MIQFLKNIWYAQRNAEAIEGFAKAITGLEDRYGCDRGRLAFYIENNVKALHIIANSNPKNANGTVRKHVRIAREALGQRR